MFIGIDLGTSGIKAVLLDRAHRVRASANAPLSVSCPQPLWREQAPLDWWRACEAALKSLLGASRAALIGPDAVEGIGLTGQMHGATLLGPSDEVLRPCILWNDGRSAAQCEELERRVPASREITGNLMMPGFTAPKLLWVAQHEPALFERVRRVLLPKDWLRLQLTGDAATDMSDASGMLWLDMARRDWSDALLSATGLSRSQLPVLHEGPAVTGRLRSDIAQSFGLRRVPVVAGGGDNAAGALGVGVHRPGQAMLSLGTSGVYFVVAHGFVANPAAAVHSFCHALPGTWHLMSVMLSAASCLDHTAALAGMRDVPSLLAAAQARGLHAATPVYLPYLNGERTPLNNPHARAGFMGIDAQSGAADLANATLEGVGHGLRAGMEAVGATGIAPSEITLIGGGSRSDYWCQMLADLTGRVLVSREGGEHGPALGAARLALHGIDGAGRDHAFPAPPRVAEFAPQPRQVDFFASRRALFDRVLAAAAATFQPPPA